MLFVPCYCLNQGTVQFTLNIGAASEVSQKVEHMLQSGPTEQIKRFKKKISTLMQCNQDQLDHWVMSKHAPVHLVEDTIHQFVWRNQCGKLLLSPSPGVSVNLEARKLGAKMKRGKLCGEHIWRSSRISFLKIEHRRWWDSYVRLSNHASNKLKEQPNFKFQVQPLLSAKGKLMSPLLWEITLFL